MLRCLSMSQEGLQTNSAGILAASAQAPHTSAPNRDKILFFRKKTWRQDFEQQDCARPGVRRDEGATPSGGGDLATLLMNLDGQGGPPVPEAD
jgi:hypothetical protein